MTKQHFIALADTLRDNRPDTSDAAKTEEYNRVTGILADFCQSQNPRFNRGRWLGYLNGECGPNGGSK